MIYFLRSRQWSACLAAAVCCGAVAGFFAQHLISVPFLGSLLVPTQMPVPVIPALLLCLMLGACITGGERQWMQAAVRNTWTHALVLVLLLASLSTVICLLACLAARQGLMPSILSGRDVAGLLSLWVIGRLLGLASSATAIPVAYVVFCSAFARNRQEEFYPWAWIMEPGPSSLAGAAAMALGLTAALMLMVRRRPLAAGRKSAEQ